MTICCDNMCGIMGIKPVAFLSNSHQDPATSIIKEKPFYCSWRGAEGTKEKKELGGRTQRNHHIPQHLQEGWLSWDTPPKPQPFLSFYS